MKAYLKRVLKAVLNRPQTVYNASKEYIVKKVDYVGELSEKVAFVTGGSGTLGRSICHLLSAQGARVYVGGRNIERVNNVVQEIQSGETV